MKILVGAAVALMGVGAIAYSMAPSKTVVPKKADPDFDYDNADFVGKKAWMTMFADRFIAAGTKAQRESGKPKTMDVRYSIDPANRHLIVDMMPLNMPAKNAAKMSAAEKQMHQQLFASLMLSKCRSNIQSLGIVGNAAVIFRLQTHYADMPVVTVELSNQSCDREKARSDKS